jgi:2,4-dienoyl-CoA reductase-like NADH-dependent reductase (Old Yellow Enzyme family)
MTITHASLEPGSLGPLQLPNRLIVAPMTRVSARPDGVPTRQMAEYYADFAAGGFGLVVTEGVYPDHAFSQGYLNQPGLVSDDQVHGWKAVTERVHQAGGRIVAQLMHAGALSQGNPHRDHTIAPSTVKPLGEMMPDYGGQGPWPVPREASAEDITDVVQGFVAAARNAVEAGFDGVEVHAANGYLLDQFITEYTNLRTDRYGGSTEARARLVAQVVERIRETVPADVVVGVRLSQTKVNDLEYRWSGGADDARIIFGAMADAGATYLHVASEGRSWFDTAVLPDGSTITSIAREVSGLPVVANGGMHDPSQAARVLAEGHADFVSLARGALANPDLPRRLAGGTGLAPFDPGMLHPDVTLDAATRWRQAV